VARRILLLLLIGSFSFYCLFFLKISIFGKARAREEKLPHKNNAKIFKH